MRFPDTYRCLYTYGWLLHISICVASGSPDVGSSMEQHVLDSAVCADGSPGVFYMATNTSSTDYVMFIQGGGACAHDEELCDEYLDDRPQSFTSTGLPDTMKAHGVLSDDLEENPLYSTYNRIFIYYCTMDAYILDSESADGTLQFRGRHLLEETLQTVLRNVSATATVVLVGSSAGGIGTFNAATWLLESFDQVSELSVVLDSSFFFDVDGTLGDMLVPLAADPSIAYSTICAEDFNGGPCCLQFNCMVQKGYYPTADDRLRGTFVLSTLQDALTGALILERGNVNSEAVESVWDVATYTGQTETSLRNLAALYNAELSFFAPSCIDHGLLLVGNVELWMCPSGTESFDTVDALCLTDEETGALSGVEFQVTLDDVRLRLAAEISVDAWERIQIDGISVRTAMEQWWNGRGDANEQVVLFDSCNDINCNPTCMSELIPGTRDESESTLVWTLVLATCAVALLVLGGGLIAVVWSVRWRNRAVGIVTSALLEESRKPRDKQALSLSDQYRHLSLTSRGHGPDGKTESVLEWNSLSYWLPPTHRRWWRTRSPSGIDTVPEEKQLLHNMDGEVPKGSLCALMGPSGSGKSTLLDLLTGRKAIGRCSGELMFNGKSIANQKGSYISQSGYMRQLHIPFLEGLSVLENLVFAVVLRYPGTLEVQTKRIETAIKLTSLEGSINTKAGGLSGGLKRRLSLALELLPDRRVLFLDEPTSGLDATSSLELMTILKRLSTKVTLVVAIHQPRPELWLLFTHAILLKDGRTVYCGPADEALSSITRFVPRSNSAQLVLPVAMEEKTDTEKPETVYSTSIGSRESSPTIDRIFADHDDADENCPTHSREREPTSNNLLAGTLQGHTSIPDRILDVLMAVDVLHVESIRASDGPLRMASSTEETAEIVTNETQPTTQAESAIEHGETKGRHVDRLIKAAPAKRKKTPVWKIAAALMARSLTSGYANELAWSTMVLGGSVAFIAGALRSADDKATAVHMVLSALITAVLPVLLTYAPLLVLRMNEDWALTSVEMEDSFYGPACATLRVVFDHLSIGVLCSFLVTLVMHLIFWYPIISELPASTLGIYAQLSSALILGAWTIIGVMDSMIVLGVGLTQALAISSAFNTIWSVFSGTVLLISTLPSFLKIITYSSPTYWSVTFALRILLDGLDRTSSCNYSGALYCTANYGDVIAHALDLHLRETGLNMVAMVGFATAGVVLLITIVNIKSRHAHILDGLGTQAFVKSAAEMNKDGKDQNATDGPQMLLPRPIVVSPPKQSSNSK